MADYDIGAAFEAIEEELIDSMMRNLSRHRAEEKEEGINWTQWQAEQLKYLEQYKKANQKKYAGKFRDINKQIDKALREAKQHGGTEQEQEILNAIKNGFKGFKRSSAAGMTGEFFKLNERKLEALIKATTNDMERAETAILRMSNDQYRKAIYNAQVYANTGAGTYEKAVDMATKDMLYSGLNCIEYANGARHTLSDYADMAIRTASKRAYLQGEGEMRQEWGVTTVIMDKRLNPCPLCLPWVGKVLIDDVWSGGSKDGKSPVTGLKYPLMSTAIEGGLYHPRCKDSHTTYFEGISTPPTGSKYTRDELDQLAEQQKQEARQQYAARQEKKYSRMERYSLDPFNKQMYGTRAEEWKAEKNKYMRTANFKTGDVDALTYALDKGSAQSYMDVSEYYKKSATPGIGNIIYEAGYDIKKHGVEISMANWIFDNLGGDITILNEVNEDKVCTPDYRWNGKLWDLKTLSSAKAANSAVRHGITQIIENPGGIILNCGNNDISLSELEQVIEKRMHWQPEHTCVDILIVHNKKLYKVIRYKK